MPRGPESFFDAVRRAKREHRLTDLLALVLEAHGGFANKLLAAAGLPEAAQVRTRIEVLTQRGRPVDLELLAYDEHGAVVARLWSENKAGARYQPEQLPDYAEDLPPQPSSRQLITIVDTLSEVPVDERSPEAPRWRCFTWRDVAVMAWEAGREATDPADRPTWQQAARRPQALASQRMLLELMTYLQEEHGVVLNPLGHEHIAAFAYLSETSGILEELVERAATLARLDIDGDVKWADDAESLWRSFDAAGTWAEALHGAPDLEAASTDFWTSARIGEPAFGVGYTLPGELADAMLSSATAGWRDAIAAQGFSVRAPDDRDWLYVRRTKYLAELIPAGVTLDLQAQELARWVDETLRLLANHNPGVDPPQPKSRRRGSRASKAGGDDESGSQAAAA
jgi:hypothetical protein